ncbi:YdcF family protein [Sphingomonas sp. RHCKR7]|uniref:YdcF family protein n=1 Tax=Sphingomonas folli TaxID=2862497 RepID=UPI001C685DF6|nr:YdcF family protein [Sphingomonas folli]MBW6529086.1 YdcF family protein [Sphingomonas folli]
MSRRAVALLLAAAVPLAAGVPVAVAAAPVRDRASEALAARLFPLLARLGPTAVPEPLRRARAARASACGEDAACVARASRWEAAEIGSVVAVTRGAALTGLPDDDAAAQLGRELRGLTAILDSYALGAAPRYPAIDGPEVAPDSTEARTRLRAAVAIAATAREGALDPSVELALALLQVNDRTDAVRADTGLDAPARRRAPALDWSRYRYTALIVTGVGPEVPDMPLSPGGLYHVRLAAERYAAGDAALIIVTGGRAHPRATRFTEAVEMRRALIERYGVPAEAIVLEPYARHTTTNLRNATRVLAGLGAPLDRPALIVCNPEQSRYIEDAPFAERNRRELGYLPGAIGARRSPTELEFRPARESLRVDPLDPLDP